MLEAYESMAVPAWSIWFTPRDMIAKYEGDDLPEGSSLLSSTLDRLVKGGGESALNLKVYDDLKKGERITTATPNSGSFNFALYGPGENGVGEITPYQVRQSALADRLEARMADMQDKMMGELIKKLDEKPEKEEKEGGFIGVISGLLDNPTIQGILIHKLAGFLGVPLVPAQPRIGSQEQAAQVAGVGEMVNVPPDQYEKLERAIPMLAKVDPKIGDHLLALAEMAINDPGRYKMALKFL